LDNACLKVTAKTMAILYRYSVAV